MFPQCFLFPIFPCCLFSFFIFLFLFPFFPVFPSSLSSFFCLFGFLVFGLYCFLYIFLCLLLVYLSVFLFVSFLSFLVVFVILVFLVCMYNANIKMKNIIIYKNMKKEQGTTTTTKSKKNRKQKQKKNKTNQKSCYVRNKNEIFRKALVCPPMCPFVFQLRFCFFFFSKSDPNSPKYGKTQSHLKGTSLATSKGISLSTFWNQKSTQNVDKLMPKMWPNECLSICFWLL